MKPWEPPRIVRSRQATGWAFQWNRPRRRRGRSRWRIGAGEVRLVVLSGIFAGLVAALMPWPQSTPDAAAPTPATATRPYAEAERSRAILAAQEGAPTRVATSALSSQGSGQPLLMRVIDGDTFDHGGVRVRIADIDTPELYGRCAYETRLAARAMRRMGALLAQGPFELHRTPDGRDEDRYGRKLRIVTRGGRSLGDQLVAEGLARTWTGRREPWC